MDQQALLAAIDEIVADLSQPATAIEKIQGWDAELKARWRDWFVDIKLKIIQGEPVPAGWGIIRAMDFDGISAKARSPLTDKAAQIGRMMDAKT